MSFSKFTINESQLIENAIEIIELNRSRCAVILNKNQKVIGVVSEGDILRAILKGVSILSPVKNIINPSFKHMTSSSNEEEIERMFHTGITLIPVLDNENRLVDVIDLVSYYRNR
jgi:CBS domain-containing protein